jgi:hypothetical protein
LGSAVNFRKKLGVVGRGMTAVLWRFFRGVLGKCVFCVRCFCGEVVVKCVVICGELTGVFSGGENMPLF